MRIAGHSYFPLVGEDRSKVVACDCGMAKVAVQLALTQFLFLAKRGHQLKEVHLMDSF